MQRKISKEFDIEEKHQDDTKSKISRESAKMKGNEERKTRRD